MTTTAVQFEKRVNELISSLKSVEKTSEKVYNLLVCYADERGIIDTAGFAGKLRAIALQIKNEAPAGYAVARKYLETANRAVKTGAEYRLQDFNNFNSFASLVRQNYEAQKEAAKAAASKKEAEAVKAALQTETEASTLEGFDSITKLTAIASKLSKKQLEQLLELAEQMLEEVERASA